MGIQARTNVPGRTAIYTDQVTRIKTVYEPPGTYLSSTVSSVSRTSHYVQRSPIVKMPLVSIGGTRRVRRPSSYSRIVMDSPTSISLKRTLFRRDADTPPGHEEIVESPWTPDYTHIASQSNGLINGYAVVSDPSTVNQAITQALNKLGDQKVQIGAALAEAKKTYDMIAEVSTSVWRSYRAMRRGNWAAVARELGLSPKKFFTGKSSVNYLLAMKYGVIPLLSDLYKGYQWFSDNRDVPLLLKVRSAGYSEHSISGSYLSQRWNGSSRHIGYCGLQAKVTVDTLRAFNQGGLTNPLAVAWEIVPYSFLIDWYLPIANMLQAYTDSSGLTFISGYTGDRNESSVDVYLEYSSEVATSVATDTGEGIVRYFSTHRNPLGGFPRPGLYVKQNWFNANHGATALALFRSAAFK